MKQLAAFASFVHSTNLLVSAAGVALCFQTAVLLDWLYIPDWFYILVFCSIFLLQGLHGFSSTQISANSQPQSISPKRRKKYALFFICLSFLISCILTFKFNERQLISLVLPGLLALAYSLSTSLFKKPGRFKNYGTLAPIMLAMGWSTATTAIPASFIPYGFDARFWWLFTVRFFYLLAICIPLHTSNDVAGEEAEKFTMASLFGEAGCYQLSYVSLAIAAAGVIPGYVIGIHVSYLLMFLTSLLITAWAVHYSRQNKTSVIRKMMLDGTMLLQSVLICIPLLIP